LSCYNTGSQKKGFSNGYVARVVAQVRLKIPALLDGPVSPDASGLRITSGIDRSAAPESSIVNSQTGSGAATQGTRQRDQNRSITDQPGEAGVTGQVEAGAFAHPETGAYLRQP
jgi:type IV secretion system protein VirB1